MKTQSFAWWCQQKNFLSEDIRRTINILLHMAGTENCELADSKLKSLTKLELNNINEISDLQPLAGLNNLTELSLSYNLV
jgi:internalin A